MENISNIGIPTDIENLIRKDDNGKFDISESIDDFANRWKHGDIVNPERRIFLHKCFKEIPGTSYNIINLIGNGNCFYEAIYAFFKMTVANFGLTFNSCEELKQTIINHIESDDEMKRDFGNVLFQEFINNIKDINCPDLEIPIFKICELFEVKICSINLINNFDRYVRKYELNSNDESDCIIIIVSTGHVYLMYPKNRSKSSIKLRQEIYNNIDDKIN